MNRGPVTPQGAGKAVTFPRGVAFMSSDPSLIPSRLRSPSWHRQTNPRKAASWERWVSLGSGWKTPAGGMQGSQVTVPAAIGFHLASCSALPGPGGVGWVFLESPHLVVIAKPLTPAALPQWPESVHAASG